MPSKIELTDRLRREGRWLEASQFRDDERQRLKAMGELTRVEANERSWDAMAAQYPALPGGETDDGLDEDMQLPDDVAQRLMELPPPDLSEDMMWIYANIRRQNVNPETAPSAGAWAMLRWARRNRPYFFSQMLPKAQAVLDRRAMKLEAKDDEVIEEDVKRAEEMWKEVDAMKKEGGAR